jgi:enoyl-CoA hydratase
MQQVRPERDGRVMTVRLDNPPRNLMTGRMVTELIELVRSLEGDDSIGAVVLTGAAEGIFITHFDVAEIVAGSQATGGRPVTARQAGVALRAVGAAERLPGSGRALASGPAAGLAALREINELFVRMNRLDKVFVAAVNGVALGGGCELALACDVRLMADGGGRIGLPEATLGLMPGGGGTQRLTRMLGSGRALEMMLESRLLSPREAQELGLVQHVVAPERLLDEATAVAARLARRSPATIEGIKRAVYEGATRSYAEGLHMEQAAFMATASSGAGIRAMELYVREDQPLEHADGAELDRRFERWHDGTAVDLNAG